MGFEIEALARLRPKNDLRVLAGEFHCLAARHASLNVTRGALVSRVIPAAGELAGRMACIILGRAARSTSKFFKPTHSFRQSGFFVCALGFWLRFGVAKSENEFAEAPLEHNMGLVHEVEIFENQKFALKLKLWHV